MCNFFLGLHWQFHNLKEALPQSQFRNILKNVGLRLQFRNCVFVILIDRQANRQAGKHTGRQVTDRQTNQQAGAYRQTGRQTDRQADKPTGRPVGGGGQTDR
jgi:hypothetical protein